MMLGGRVLVGMIAAAALNGGWADARAAEIQASCMTVKRPVAAGAVLGARDLTPASCSQRTAAFPFRYDPTVKAMRAMRAIMAGEKVAAIPAFALPAIRPGDQLTLLAQIGSVVVERQVEAIQTAHAGAALFVRAKDGSVFAVAAEELER